MQPRGTGNVLDIGTERGCLPSPNRDGQRTIENIGGGCSNNRAYIRCLILKSMDKFFKPVDKVITVSFFITFYVYNISFVPSYIFFFHLNPMIFEKRAIFFLIILLRSFTLRNFLRVNCSIINDSIEYIIYIERADKQDCV